MGLSPSGISLSLRRDDEALLIKGVTPSFRVTCDDIARLAFAMHESHLFFIHRHGLKLDFCRDLNGGGTQRLTITPSGSGEVPNWTLEAFYTPIYSDDPWIYQADLLMDGRKDYDPVINRGKHGFCADSIHIRVPPSETVADWFVANYLVWEKELGRVQLPYSTLRQWFESGFHMWVTCQDAFCHRAVLSNDSLKQYADTGLTVEELSARMRCTQCGKRGARVKPC